MQPFKTFTLTILLFFIASCSIPSVKTDLLVKLSNSNSPLTGQAIASPTAPNGVFRISNREGLFCSGTYDKTSQARILRTNITCNNGKRGWVEVVRSGQYLKNGYGKGSFNDGTTFTLQMGELINRSGNYHIQPYQQQPSRINDNLNVLADTLALLAPALVPGLNTYQQDEKITVCAKYMTRSGWSKGYRVQATLTDGSNLNRATRTTNYNSFSKYVVIFWGRNQASIIKLDSPYLSAIDQTGSDQQGKRWTVSTSNICF